MRVGDIGEFALIDRLRAAIADENDRRANALRGRGVRLLRGIGDDAAAWDADAGARVLTTDALVEGVHFDLAYTGWRELGWKCMAANVSDIAAMGCVPTCAAVTLGLRPDLPVAGLEAMYAGMMDVPGVDAAVIGGDVVKSPVFFVSVALEGAAPSGDAALMTRDAATPGDWVCLTGVVGSSAAGLRLLQDPGAAPRGMDPGLAAALKRAHSRPTPSVGAGVRIAAAGARCAMDVSDGLLADLAKICEASGAGARIDAHRLPTEAGLRDAFPDDWLRMALTGGEDYVILFAAPPDVCRELARSRDLPVYAIGEIAAGEPRVQVMDADGRPMRFDGGGWDHFRGG